MSAQRDRRSVAVIGMACRFPGARDIDAYWRNLLDGASFLAPLDEDDLRARGVPDDVRTREGYVPVSGELDGVDEFDASWFGIAPAEAAAMDPQHRLFLQEAVHALEHAGWAGGAAGSRVGVFCGSGENRYARLLPEPGSGAGSHRSMSDAPAMLPLRVSYHLDLRGPSVFVSSLCSTSLTAVHLARQSLLAGDCDIALAGAVSVQLPQDHGYVAQDGGVMSPDGGLRPFDASARGTVPGSGVGVVVLRRLDEALGDGDHIHAVLHGTALNNDGADRQSFAAPSVGGQREVVMAALAEAGVDPGTIGLVEAHGTGTPLGDPVELAALREARERLGVTTPCAIGTVKSSIGHLDSAAGMAGLIKAVLAVREGVVPATVGHRELNPAADLTGSGLYVATERRPWPDDAHPRRAAVSALGVGGTNAHVVVGQFRPGPEQSGGAEADLPGPEVFPLSARTSAAFHRLRERLAEALGERHEVSGADVARTLQDGRRPRELRRAWVAASPDELGTALKEDADPTPTGPVELVVDLAKPVDPAPSVTERLPLLGKALGHPEGAERAFLLGHAALESLAALGVAPDVLHAAGAGEYLAAAFAGALDHDVALRCAVRHERIRELVTSSGDLSACEAELAAIERELDTSPPAPAAVALRSAALGITVPAGSALSASHFLEVSQAAAMGDDVTAGGPGLPDVLDALSSWRSWLTLAAYCWERGADVEWAALRGPAGRRVPLPLYPFEPVRHWAAAEPAWPAPHAALADEAPRTGTGTAVDVDADTDVLAEVVAIWEAVLGVADVDREASFFVLGGHSLVAAQIVARLRERFGVRVPVGDLLDAETPAGMAELVAERVASARLYEELTTTGDDDTTGTFEL
ncbi:beta-ketoacyl synthase N-terminal-like domain-containing protein [Streptomyces sp. NPDC015127]|uniref:beta-ketoacyl synthase N-terminal-like domain-containing protein n=1 Tax=Streptomyces sp. NPDC015127 TaxID=3364939 RepID=UPI0036F56068